MMPSRLLTLVALCFLLVPFRLGAAADAEEPRTQADRLAAAIAAHEAIAQGGGWPSVPAGPMFEPGKADARVPALRRRLQITGDLAGTGGGVLYDAELSRAVRQFQRRHGLVIDGRVGEATLDALNVSAEARVAQLRLNLRRAQQLPGPGATYLRVNVAAANLDAIKDGRIVARVPVIVGDTRHPTPEFAAQITGVVFNPPWVVPRSIATREILPRLRRDPGYLASQGIAIVERPNDPYGRGVDWHALEGFPFTLRQAPGPRNALGRIKFDMPNPYDVYLHDTPTKQLFDKPVRAFSHGCIRVARPRELAAYVLGPSWSAADIDAAIAGGETRRVPVDPPMPVRVVYLTAFVDPDGTVQFRRDLYARERLVAASAEPAEPAGCGADATIG